MAIWAFFLGGLLVWAAHFFTLYTISSVFLTTPLARVLVGIATLLAVAANAFLLLLAKRRVAGRADVLDGWVAGLAVLMAALSLVAVLWQAFPALLM